MRVGEKVICIKDFYPHLKKNKIYNIIRIHSEYWAKENILTITTEQNSVTISYDESDEFDEYFITLKKYRKLKIKKINSRTSVIVDAESVNN